MTKSVDLDLMQKQKRIAWEIAAATALETRDDAVLIYERIMRDWESKHQSNESQISGNM